MATASARGEAALDAAGRGARRRMARLCRKAVWGTDVLANYEIRIVKSEGVMIRSAE